MTQRFVLKSSLSTVAATASALVFSGLVACGSGSEVEDSSDVNQLTAKMIDCVEYPEAQIQANLTGMPDGFFRKNTWQTKDLQRARNALAGVPSEYLQWLYQAHQRNNFYIFQRPLGGSTIGLTQFGSDWPDYIQITNKDWAADFALQHEVGHAMQVKLRRAQGFQRLLQDGYQKESRNSKLRSYARTSTAEYFAESFNNFYCSQEANRFIQEQLPTTYAFLKSRLLPPRWESTGGLPGGSSTITTDPYLKLGAVDAADQAIPLTIAAASSAVRAGLCRGDKQSCTSTKREDIRFQTAPTLVGDRKLFASLTGISPVADEVVTLLIFDAQDSVIAANAVRFAAR
jgi:hypothetical protein